MRKLTDKARLDWLEKQDGCGLVSDDAGRWAVSTGGLQNMPDTVNPIDISSTFFVESQQWEPSIREAIDKAIKDDISEKDYEKANY